MIARWHLWVGGILLVAVVAAALYFPALRKRVDSAAQLTEKTAEQARRELLPSAAPSSGETMTKVKMFWGSNAGDGTLTPVTIELPLAKDPVLRARQVINTLLAGPVNPDARTLPPEAALLAFYILPDGTGIADFSEAMATSIPSGIQSEQRAVDSIARTLEADVPQVTRLKILIHGQEVDTLAGHIDLTQTFRVNTKAGTMAPLAAASSSVPTAPANKPAPVAATAKDPASSSVKR
jgi:Sporulation and spore germination